MSNTVNVEVEYEGKTYNIPLERGYYYDHSNNPEEARKHGGKYDYKAAVRQDVEEAIFWRLEMESGFAQDVLDESRKTEDEVIEEAQQSVEYDSYFGNEEDAELALVGNNDLVQRVKMELGMEYTTAEQKDIMIRNLLAYTAAPMILSELAMEMQEYIDEQEEKEGTEEDEAA